jgi:predicted dehydrogenase/threonine dehydrogenase-like Zn-dependent dehydrogenase
MKQILQSLKTGNIEVSDVPSPLPTINTVLIRSNCSLISTGTERMLIEFGKASYLDKARRQPDKVKQVLNKAMTDGFISTYEAIRSKLDQPIPLGYCNVGVVLENFSKSFKAGDRVVSNGSHAEVVRVPQNLCAKIPDNVDDESASFVVLGSIGLQGIRLLNPTLGESIVVSGLGLVGLLVVQMLIANGCRVLGVDMDASRCALARKYGAETVDLSGNEDPTSMALSFSRGRGVDGVIITAASSSDEVIHQAAEMCRKRGRIVLVGVVGLNLRRDDFFKKELTFQVSASYGPGRYDPSYEEKGNDYPIGFVRWTEQRNFEAVLDMLASGALDVKHLVTHRYQISEALKGYALLGDPAALGILLEYPHSTDRNLQNSIISISNESHAPLHPSISGEAEPVVAFIGAGNYASRTLIPAFKAAGARLKILITSSGVTAVHHGKNAGFLAASTDQKMAWTDSAVNTVVIATRHNLHAMQTQESLKAFKNVFVEKPLALNLSELREIKAVYEGTRFIGQPSPLLMVGFNRRFAPLSLKMKSLLAKCRDPKVFIITVNAGAISSDHWTQDINEGGGRIIGEGCHFIDLMRFLVGSPITNHKSMMQSASLDNSVCNDKVSIMLSFEDGSFGTIHYLANGGKSFSKERIEVFCAGKILQLDNFRILRGFDWPGFSYTRLWRQDKGQHECVKSFVDAIRDGRDAPISSEEIFEVSRVAIEIAEGLSC